jgi:Raf kinase inhibitor-like YbhB/YbcL family protein
MRPARCAAFLALALAFHAGVAAASSIDVESSAFLNGGPMPAFDSASTQGCTGSNVSPPLRITGVPAAARSLAIVLFDTDANAGAGFVHWVAYGVDPAIVSVPSGFGTSPGAYVGGRNDAGTMRYFGPCPPLGDPKHHYTFTVYALALGRAHLPPGLTRTTLLHDIARSTLAVGTLTATFAR